MGPDLSEFAQAISGATLVWVVFCFDEQDQIGKAVTDSDEAAQLAMRHSKETGHAAEALPSFGLDNLVEASVVLIPFLFCFRFNGNPWQTMVVTAPSPETAAATAAAIVRLLNEVAPSLGHQPLFDAVGGACSS